MTRIRYFTTILAALITLNPTLAMPATGDTADQHEPIPQVIQENTPLYEDLIRYAVLWKDAVLADDGPALAKISNPYERATINSQMKEKTSQLHIALYGKPDDKKPTRKYPYDILKNAKKLKITLVAVKPIRQYGVIAYYYDQDAGPVDMPPKEDTQAEDATQSIVACPFQWSGATWYADFLQTYAPDTEELGN